MKTKKTLKPYLLGGAFGVCITLCFAFRTMEYQIKNSTSDVAQIEGIYINDCPQR